MTRRTTPILLTLALLPLACSNPADDKVRATVSAPKPEAAPEPSPTGADVAAVGGNTLTLTPETSKVDFVGSKVTGSHAGGFKAFTGTIELADDKPEVKKLTAEIDMDSTWSDNDRLTGHLKSPDFFDVAKHPKSTFVSTEITPGGENGATHTVTGNFTLHGVTKSISFPAKIAVTDEAATVDSEFVINRKDFGVSYEGKTNDLIRNEVVIKLALKAPRSASKS